MKAIKLNPNYFITADSRQFILNTGSGSGFRSVSFAQTLSQILHIAVEQEIRLTPDALQLSASVEQIHKEITRVLKPLDNGYPVCSLFGECPELSTDGKAKNEEGDEDTEDTNTDDLSGLL